MQPDSSRLSIDLGKRSDESTSDALVKWTVNSGKIIIVVVELLTLGALAFRFTIDRQITDINEKIKRQQGFVEAQTRKENLYRNLQLRLTEIQTISDASITQVTFINQLSTILSGDEFLSGSVSTTPGSVTIEGQVYSIFTLDKLIEVIKENPSTTTLSLDEVESSEQGVKFRITARMKEAQS